MNRRQCLWGLLFLAVTVVVVVAVWQLAQLQQADRRYTDLESWLAPEAKNGWVLSVPPRRPGPYRLLPGGPMLGIYQKRVWSAGFGTITE